MKQDAQTMRPENVDEHPPRNGNTWVIIGGGRLGRGFLNDVADDLKLHTILFVAGRHTPRPLDNLYNQQRSSGDGYRILAAPDFSGHRALCNYHFDISIDTSLLISAICADTTVVVSTSVGLNNLSHVAPYIAEGLRRRAACNLPKIPLIICENGRTVHNESPSVYLSTLLDTLLQPFGLTCNQIAIIPQTVVECAVPALPARPSDRIYRRENTIWIEDIEDIPILLRHSRLFCVCNNMDVIQTRKLYGYNSLHCFLSVLGCFYGEENVQIVARAERLTPIFQQLKGALCDAIKAEHNHRAITEVENSDQELSAYADSCLKRLKQPLADTLDPVSRALEKVCNGWYLNDGRILGPARALGLFERPWERPVLVHILSLCFYLYVRSIDSFRNRMPFLSHAFIDNLVETDTIDFVKLEGHPLLSEDAENLPITEVIADDFQELQRRQQEQDVTLDSLVEFINKTIKQPIIPVPRSCRRLITKAVVFDLDEWLVSTERILYEVTKGILKDYAACEPNRLPHEVYAGYVGWSEEAFFERMKMEFCIRDLSAAELVKEREQRFTEQIKQAGREGLIKPWFRPLLSCLADYRVHMAVHLNASRKRVDATLKHTGLEMFFSEVKSSTDPGMRDKPAPTMLFDIFKKLNIEPPECIVVESSRNGVQSALNAGCYCVLLSNEYTAPKPIVERKGVSVVANAQQLSSWFLQLTRSHKHIGRCADMTDEEWRAFRNQLIRRFLS